MRLDGNESLQALDSTNMFQLMGESHTRLSLPKEAPSTCPPDQRKPDRVLFVGMGGSAIVGDIIADYAREALDIPVWVSRSVRLPSFTDKDTLLIAVSYSGETSETLRAFHQAKKKGMRIIVISSDGTLLSQAYESRIPFVRVRGAMLPRVALPELIATSLHVMESASILKNKDRLITDLAENIKRQVAAVKPSVPFDRNPAKQMATRLEGKLPVLLGSEDYASVLRRFKNQLNENSKLPAFYCPFPEGYHDDVEGFRMLHEIVDAQPICFLTSREDSTEESQRREKLLSYLQAVGFPSPLKFEGIGKDKMSEMLTAVTFADYVSVYLAILRDVDPGVLSTIPTFRAITR